MVWPGQIPSFNRSVLVGGLCILKLLAKLDGRANRADGPQVGPRSGRRGAPTQWRSGAAAWASGTSRKNETVILVIYGYFWLFFIQIFIVTYCFTIVCVNFLSCTPGGPEFRGRRCKKCTNNFVMHGARGLIQERAKTGAGTARSRVFTIIKQTMGTSRPHPGS